jgi:hypothetical protein
MTPSNSHEMSGASDSGPEAAGKIDWRSRESQKWWKASIASKAKEMHSHRGEACPKCYLADLDYDTLFRLSCPNCGYIAECGAFT